MSETPRTEHVIDEEGHFHVEDAPIDLGQYLIEDWGSLAFSGCSAYRVLSVLHALC